MPDVVLTANPPVVPTVLPLMPLPPVAIAADVWALLVLRLDDERCRRDGVGWLAPSVVLCALKSGASVTPAEVEDVVEATEAVCCRNSVNSRVKRLTTASCSFSNCIWRSAAVSGLGCRRGPGPGSTPVLSSRGIPLLEDIEGKVGERGGVDEKRLVDGEVTRSESRRGSDGRLAVEDGAWLR